MLSPRLKNSSIAHACDVCLERAPPAAASGVGSSSSSSSLAATKGFHGSKQSPPQFALAIESQNVREGEPAVFRCRVAGNPPPQVSWEREDQPIKPSRYFIMSQEGADTHVLRISEAFPEDEGVYRCVAASSAGKAICSASLSVRGTH